MSNGKNGINEIKKAQKKTVLVVGDWSSFNSQNVLLYGNY